MKLIFITLLHFFCFYAFAQQAIIPSGGSVTGTGGSTSYSVGQLVYTTHNGSNGTITQGVQQPFEISIITEIETAKDIDLQISSYPNPVNNLLVLKIENYPLENLNYQILDISGKTIENKKVTSNETHISVNHLSPATYLFRISENNKDIKAFKIIKN